MTVEKRKTRLSAATLRRAVENRNMCKTARLSTKNDTASAPPGQAVQIDDFCHLSEETSASRQDLMALTGYFDRLIIGETEV